MKTVNVITEGQSERDFINVVLRPYTKSLGLTLNPVVVATGSKHGRPHQGGTVKFEVLKPQLDEFLQLGPVLTTTMFDYVQLHKSFFELPDLSSSSDMPAAEDIEAAMYRALGCPSNFIPYIMQYEFEALLFSTKTNLPNRMNATTEQRAQFLSVFRAFPNPEEINSQSSQSPSRRIKRIFPRFRKITHGVSALERIGVDAIRQRCPRFNWWLGQLLTGT